MLEKSRVVTLSMVALGGAIGATLRFLCVGWVGKLLGATFPYGTLVVNVLGSLVMGVLAVVMLERLPGAWSRYAPLLITGVLGGFTTFSAFSLDAFYLIERGRHGAAALYIGGSVALSILGLWLGLTAARAALN